MWQRHPVRARSRCALLSLGAHIALTALFLALTESPAFAVIGGGPTPPPTPSLPPPAVQPYIPGDINGDGVVDIRDLKILEGYIGKPAYMCPACNLTHNDSIISVADARTLVTLCTYPRCAIEPSTPVTISETFDPVPGLVGRLLSISPNGVGIIPAWAATATFTVAATHTQYVQVKDSERAFGWLAVWPSWFTLEPQTPIGPLSTAAAMVFMVPGIFTDELQQQDSYMKVLLALPQIDALANALQAQANTADPLATSAVQRAYKNAIVAAFLDLNSSITNGVSAATVASNSIGSARPFQAVNVDPFVTQLLEDQIWLSINEQTLMPAWTGTTDKPSLLDNYGLNEDMYSLGVVYPVDTSAYSTESHLSGLWGVAGSYNPFFSTTTIQTQSVNPSAVVLANSTPQGTFILDPAYTLWDAIDNVSTLVPLVYGNLTGAQEVDSTGFPLPSPTAEYIVHMYTCATGVGNPNTNAELNLISAWDNGTAALEFADSCTLNVTSFSLAELSDLGLLPNVGVGSVSTSTFVNYFLRDLSTEIGNNPNNVQTAVGALACAVLNQNNVVAEHVGNYYCTREETSTISQDYVLAVASFLTLEGKAALKAGEQILAQPSDNAIVSISESLAGDLQTFATEGATPLLAGVGNAGTWIADSIKLEPWQGALVQVGNPWELPVIEPPLFVQPSSVSGNKISSPFVYDVATAPRTAVTLGVGGGEYFYIGSTAGGTNVCGCVGGYGQNPMTNMTWSPDLNVTASVSGNRSISIGRSSLATGSYDTSAGNHGIAGLGLTGYYVAAEYHNFTRNGTTITVPFAISAGDIALIAVGGQGTGDIVLSGIPAESLTDQTYSESGSDVIASEAFYVSTSLSAGTYFAALSSTTYPTNASAAIGAVVYVLAPDQ